MKKAPHMLFNGIRKDFIMSKQPDLKSSNFNRKFLILTVNWEIWKTKICLFSLKYASSRVFANRQGCKDGHFISLTMNLGQPHPVIVAYQSYSFVTTAWDRPRISGSANPNEIKLGGPISIGRDNLVSKLDYNDNYEISFEYKAFVVPSSTGRWYQILSGSLITFIFSTH